MQQTLQHQKTSHLAGQPVPVPSQVGLQLLEHDAPVDDEVVLPVQRPHRAVLQLNGRVHDLEPSILEDLGCLGCLAVGSVVG